MASTQETITFRQHLRPEQVGSYVLLPFEVPADAARIDVEYSYDQAIEPAPGNAIDLGIFDARGATLGSGAGFRGWSGTARTSAFISPGEATPGYLPGPLRPGQWHILLGLYKIHPSGCNYEVAVRLTRGPAPAPEPPSLPAPPVHRETRWYCGDLHCHSHHSEATGTLAELCAAARTQGLDFLAVTEHNTTSHHRLLGQFHTSDFLPIPGEEITTYYGHGNVWGANAWVDFRCRHDVDLARTISAAHVAGGLFSANHPKTQGPPWEFGTFAGIDCLEVWQGPWFLSNYQSLAKWEALLQSGERVTGVGGSDQHQPAGSDASAWHQVGQPTTWVYAPALEQRAILQAIKAGHVFISASPAGPMLELTAASGAGEAMMGDTLAAVAGQPLQVRARVRGGEGLVLRLLGPEGVLAEQAIVGANLVCEHTLSAPWPAYVRAEVIQPLDPAEAHEPAALMMQAMSNPVYIR